MKLPDTLRLRFADPEQEASFRVFYCLRFRHHTRIALLAGALLIALFAASDWLLDAHGAHLTVGLRLFVLVPLMVATAAVLASPRSESVYEPVATTVACLISLTLDVIYWHLQSSLTRAGLGLILLMLATIFIIRLRFAYFAIFLLVTWLAFLGTVLVTRESAPGLLVANVLAVSAAMVLGLYGARIRESENRREYLLFNEVAAAKTRIEELLHSMLPAEIATRIQRGESPVADAHQEVSIVFADLVGFTALARQLSPSELVQLLDRLFSEFDELAARHQVERIKTIGDAYMAVAGLDEAAPDHAERATRFALAVQERTAELARETGFALSMRIGLHIGPIIAGVIGTSKPAYDCWGEAVNLASRLESGSREPGVHISEAAWRRLREGFVTRELLPIVLKGLGPIPVWRVEGERSNDDPARGMAARSPLPPARTV